MSSREMIELVVRESLERGIPRPTRRDARLHAVPGKADAVIGMRRTGKTWLLYREMQELLAAGVPRERMLYVNFEDERLQPLTMHDPRLLLETLQRFAPLSGSDPYRLFFDEVQCVPDWERFVRRMVDSGEARVVVTGSSAKLLATEVHTSLRGRSLATELLPFGFRELLRHRGIDPPRRWPATAKARAPLQHAFDAFVTTGGFPEVLDAPDAARTAILQEYVDVLLERDVIERHRVTSPTVLRALVRHLLRSPACKFSANKFHRDLRSQGHAVGKDAVYAYLGHLEDAFLVHLVEIETESERARRANPRKVYTADHALARAFAQTAAPDTGRTLESLIYVELRRRDASRIRYYVTQSGREVDFVTTSRNAERALIQVCADLADAATRARESDALAEAMRELDLPRGTIVTMDDEETIATEGGEVRVVPAWRWLLEN